MAKTVDISNTLFFVVSSPPRTATIYDMTKSHHEKSLLNHLSTAFLIEKSVKTEYILNRDIEIYLGGVGT